MRSLKNNQTIMKNKLEEISNLITKARNQIESAMLEILAENNNDTIVFDRPIEVTNNDDYDIPGTVYEVSLDYDSNDNPLVVIFATWGRCYSKDDAEWYYVSDFTTDDLEWILTRMYETL